MELNQTSMIPFSVNDPITGTDITKDVRLTAIEVGGQPSPYLKPNGDYSFTVVGADETDLTEEATFKLEVDWEGSPFPLEAKTDVTVKGTTASQLVVRIVGSFDGHERVLLTNGFMVQFQVSYHGRLLGAGEIGVNNTVNTNSGLGIEYKGVLEDGVTHRMDVTGKALGDSLWFMVHVFRPEEPAKTVVLQGYADVVSPSATDLRIWIEPRYRAINGVKGDKQIVFCKYYRGVNPVTYNAPGMSVRLAGNVAADDAGVKFIEALPEGLVGEFLPEVSAKTNYIINVVMVYNGVTARSGTSWYCHKRPAAFPTQFGILPKYKVLANSDENWVWQVTDLNYPDNYDASNRPTAKGAIIEKGELVGIDMVTFANLYKEPFTNIPLNSLKQFATRHAVDYRKQTYNIQAMYLKVRFEAETPLWEKQWQYGRLADYGDVIEEAPYTFKASSDAITGVTGRSPTIYITATQDRGNGSEVINGMFSAVTVTGAASYKSLYNLEGNLGVLSMNARGLTGDVLIKGTFTTADTPAQVKTFEITIQADSALDINIPYQNLPAKVWDVFTQFPMIIKSGVTDVSANVVDFRIIDNDYVKSLNTEPYSWEIAKGLTSSAIRVNTYFLFTLELDGQRYDLIDFLDYTIAQFTGKTFTSTADYGEGLGITTGIKVGQCIENGFTVYPVYKGKPKTDGISAVITTSGWFSNVPCRVHSLTEDGLGINFVYDAPCTGSIGTTVSASVILTIDGTPGTTADVDKWTGTFTLSIISGSGLYIAPITLTPSNQQYGKVITWNSGIYLKARRILPTDPDLKLEVKAGADAIGLKIVGYSGYLVYFVFTTPGTSSNVIRNYLVGTHTLGGSSGNVALNALYGGSVGLPVTMEVVGDALANSDNVVAVKFIRNKVDIGKPKSITSVFGRDEPANGNALVGELTLIDNPSGLTHSALHFGSGWTGGTVYPEIVAEFDGLADLWYVRDPSIPVLPAPITVYSADTVIDGLAGVSKVITFTLSQERLIDDQLSQYNFAEATIAPTGTVTGALQKVDNISNANGTFQATFYGKGETGEGTALFTITDTDGFVYTVGVTTTAEIDSTGMVFSLTKSEISGVNGYRELLTGNLTYNGSKLNMADAGITYTVEPAGYAAVISKDSSAITVEIRRKTSQVETMDCEVVANWGGRTARAPLRIEVQPVIIATQKLMNVKVWDTVSGFPFTVKDGTTDISGTITDIYPEDTTWFKSTGLGNRFIIQADGPEPAQDFTVRWFYKAPGSTVEHHIDVVYHLAAYDGNILTYNLSGDRILPTGKKTNLGIDVLIRGVRTTSMISYVGVGDSPLYLTYNSGTPFAGQFTVVFTTNNIRCIEEPMKWIFKVDGGYEGNPSGEFVVDYVVTIWDATEALFVSPFEPAEITGKFGDTFELKCKATWQGNKLSMKSISVVSMDPTGVIVYDTAAATENSVTVKFVKDIDANKVVTNVKTSFGYYIYAHRSVNDLLITQQAITPKLFPAPGFQTSGQGDMENPVTLQQSVLNPE